MSAPAMEGRLYQRAAQQAGYFTAVQAKESGFSQRQISYQVKTGRWRRILPGVYRLPFFPAFSFEDVVIAWLAVGEKAVISHESALALYDISDVLPRETHLTVPRTTSRRRRGVRLHTSELGPEDITLLEGLPVTTLPRTLADVSASGLADDLVVQAIHQALSKGLVSREALIDYAEKRGGRMLTLVRRTLRGQAG